MNINGHFQNNFIFKSIISFILHLQILFSFSFHLLTINTPYQYKPNNLSFFGQQLYIRLCFFFQNKEISKLKKRDDKFRILFDVVLGIILSYVIFKNSTSILNWSKFIFQYLKSILINHIHWLMGWPGGLKLNDYLDNAFGSVSIGCINWWSATLDNILVYPLIYCLSFISLFGCSFFISLFNDVLSFTTSYLFLFYLLFSRIYSVQISIILSLWRLFRGLKKNNLRNRIDSCDYTVPQMILGSLFFTLLIFLFPTVAVYYFTFTFLRIIITIIESFLVFLLIFFNSFPFYLFLLRFFDPQKLPSGIWFRILGQKENISYFKMESKPISYWNILFHSKIENESSIDIEIIYQLFTLILLGKILPREFITFQMTETYTTDDFKQLLNKI